MSSGPSTVTGGASDQAGTKPAANDSLPQHSITSEDSQTAADFIRSQELLEADAREALPYRIDTCTNLLGPLRQNVFACLTCNPAPKTPEEIWEPAGVCYACSIQCHGEHTLVEIFQKRNFTCDCGTTRIPSTNPCRLRMNMVTYVRGDVHSDEPDANNKYNHNFQNRFCGCMCDYDPFKQKGTMFQCLGLGTAETGGCGEDWYHPGCLVGTDPEWFEKMEKAKKGKKAASPKSVPRGESSLPTISEDVEGQAEPCDNGEEKEAMSNEEDDDEQPLPPGFPEESSFEGFICYKCVESNPWIRHYAGTPGFLPPVYLDGGLKEPGASSSVSTPAVTNGHTDETVSKKRKTTEEEDEQNEAKRVKSQTEVDPGEAPGDPESTSSEVPLALPTWPADCKVPSLNAPPPEARFSIFFKEDFRDHFCRCKQCYLFLNTHPQLLEEEEVYEPPISDGGGSEAGRNGGGSHGSGSLLERGESALQNVDRVRAIQGAMAYHTLKGKLQPFFEKHARSGEAISAEEVIAFFAELRGDDEAIREAGQRAAEAREQEDQRREQGGY